MAASPTPADETLSTSQTVGSSAFGPYSVGSITHIDRRPGAGAPLLPGAVVGHYVIRRRLGAGGMGEVFVAYDAQLDREVALKLIHGCAQDDESLSAQEHARLRAEAQSLARLSHPNVVQIHEVGEHEGRTFLAMEFVDGPTLSDWAPASLDELLEVYVQAGRGLAAAHEAGLVHRDFKPSNVLLGADGRVRVVDFGLAINRQHLHESAQTLNDDDSGGTHDSRATRVAGPGTLVYMAPEQAFLGNGGPAADQFSFCVALFEAVYGDRPFPARNPMELLYKLDVGELELPAAGRYPVPRWLRKLLRRGLSRHPRDRFESMDALLAELARDRKGRRRRIGVAALVTGLTALVISLGVETPPPPAPPPPGLEDVWGEAEREAVAAAFDRIDAPWAQASENAVIAGLDHWAARWLAVARDAQVRGVLDDPGVTSCLDVQRAQASLMIVAVAHGEPALLEGAVGAVDALPEPGRCVLAVGLGPRIGPSPAASPELLHPQLTELGNAAAQRSLGRAELAHQSASLVLDAARARGWADVELAALRQRGLAQLDAGRQAAGFDDLLTARELAIKADDDRAAAELSVDLAWASRELDNPALRRDRLTLARAHVAQLHANARSEHAVRHARTLQIHVDLSEALAHFDASETEAAERLLTKGLQALAGLDARDTELALLHLHVLANTHRRAHRFAEAEADFERALTKAEQIRGPRHPSNAKLWYDAGALALERGEPELARERLVRARDLRRDALSVDHPDLAHSELGLATLELSLKDYETARVHAERALTLLDRDGLDQDGLGETLRLLGQIAAHDQDWATAQRYYERALVHVREDIQIVLVELHLGKTLAAQGQHLRGLELMNRCLPILAERFGPERCNKLISSYERQADASRALGRIEDAARSLSRARACTHDPDILERLDTALDNLE